MSYSLDVQAISCNRLVPYYLMSCYLYYEQDKHVLSDDQFDAVCKRLLSEFDLVDHPHKHLVDHEALAAGTGYNIKEYPSMVIGAATRWYKERLQTPPLVAQSSNGPRSTLESFFE